MKIPKIPSEKWRPQNVFYNQKHGYTRQKNVVPVGDSYGVLFWNYGSRLLLRLVCAGTVLFGAIFSVRLTRSKNEIKLLVPFLKKNAFDALFIFSTELSTPCYPEAVFFCKSGIQNMIKGTKNKHVPNSKKRGHWFWKICLLENSALGKFSPQKFYPLENIPPWKFSLGKFPRAEIYQGGKFPRGDFQGEIYPLGNSHLENFPAGYFPTS